MLLKLLKTKFPLFALSLLLSFMFWLMVSASGTSTREIPVALEVSLPDEKVAVLGQPFPERITLRVEANTAQFKLIENRNLIYSVDLSKEEPGSKVLRFNLEELLGVLQLPRGVNVSRVQPAEIPYQLYGFITKLVPVDMSLTDNYDENLVVSGPVVIEPTEVQVTGPSNLMEHVTSVPVIVSRASVTPGVKLEVKPNLSSFGSNVEVDPKAVFMASSDVSWKRTNLTVNVPVAVTVDSANSSLESSSVLASDYTLSTNPESVSVTLSWPANHPSPEPDSSGGLKAMTTVDIRELERLGGMRLNVNVETPYPDLEILRINPNRVYVTYKRLPAAPAAPAAPSAAPSSSTSTAPSSSPPVSMPSEAQGNLSSTSSPRGLNDSSAIEDLASSQENSD